MAPTTETAPNAEILPTPTTPSTSKASRFDKSAAIGTIEVSPETKAEFQVPEQHSVEDIALPDNSSPNFLERIFASLGSPATTTTTAKPVQPGQFDAGPNRGVKFFRTDI